MFVCIILTSLNRFVKRSEACSTLFLEVDDLTAMVAPDRARSFWAWLFEPEVLNGLEPLSS